MDGQLVAYGDPFTECVVMHEFDKKIFLNEHYMIDRREVPVELYKMIYDASKKYLANTPFEFPFPKVK